MATQNTVKKPSVIKERWEALPPKTKKAASGGAMLLVVLLGSFMIVGGDDDTAGAPGATAQGKIQNALLPDEGGRDLGMSSVGKDMKSMSTRMRQMENENERLKTQVNRQQSNGGASADQRLMEEIGTLRSQLGEMKTSQDGIQRRQAELDARPVSSEMGQGTEAGQAQSMPAAFGGIRAVGQTPLDDAPPSNSIEVNNEDTQAAGMVKASLERKIQDKDRFYLPAGSIMQGVLLSGVDAPSGKSAMKDPVPVLARIKEDAILANRFRADVKECFMLLETVGDMASERAMMRAITLSCVRQDRTVIEVPMSGYAVGEDGRAGLRGELVTKQGAVLGKAALAGFADGLAKAFGGGNSFAIGGNGGGISGESFSTGAMSGAGSALDRVSQWYLERADELTPTISIDSGRQITVVLTKGRELAALGAGTSAAASGP